MPATLSLTDARAILGDDVLGPDEIAAVFGTAASAARIPFSRDDLAGAARQGEMLVWRVTTDGNGAPLTLLYMVERLPEAFDQKLLRQMGYQLKDDWGIEREPLAATDRCAPGWALVRKEILDDSRNRTYDQQEVVLQRYAGSVGASAGSVRRRSGVEAVYDSVLYFAARKTRLLAQSWDWSSSATIDGGYLNVGGFGSSGLQILSFSRAVRHGGLGVCPTRQGAE